MSYNFEHFLNLDLFKNVRIKTVRIIHFLLHMLKKMIQNRSILYEFLRLQKKSQNPSYPTTFGSVFYECTSLETIEFSECENTVIRDKTFCK